MRTLAESMALINTYLPDVTFKCEDEEFANLTANAVVSVIVQMGSGLYPFKGVKGREIWDRAREEAAFWNSLDKPRPAKPVEEQETNHHKIADPNSKIYRAVQLYNESTDKSKSYIVGRYVTELEIPHQSAMTYYHLIKSGRYR